MVSETVITVSETIKESSSKEDSPVGIPGSQSNLPAQAPTSDESSDEKFQSATNYEYSQTTERTILSPGTPQRVSASIMVNSVALQSVVDSRVYNGLQGHGINHNRC